MLLASNVFVLAAASTVLGTQQGSCRASPGWFSSSSLLQSAVQPRELSSTVHEQDVKASVEDDFIGDLPRDQQVQAQSHDDAFDKEEAVLDALTETVQSLNLTGQTGKIERPTLESSVVQLQESSTDRFTLNAAESKANMASSKSPENDQVNKSELDKAQAIFAHIDKDNSGSVDVAELAGAIKELDGLRKQLAQAQGDLQSDALMCLEPVYDFLTLKWDVR